MQEHKIRYSALFLGNIRAVVSGDGRVLETNNYYPYGMQIKPLSQTYYTSSDVKNRYKYNGKELFSDNGLDWLAYGARMYDATTARWWVQDPKAEAARAWSVYRYGYDNPINVVDPDGNFESTWVIKQDDGTYKVVGGDITDGDNGIYLAKDETGKERTDILIGYTATPYSFYNSDISTSNINDKRHWQGVIDPKDKSGVKFLNNFVNNTPGLIEYMSNATGGQKYDFKRTNGTNNVIYTTTEQFYRGMPINRASDGLPIYASARDVGNMAAGIIAGFYGILWAADRLAFDALETHQRTGRWGVSVKEGLSTQYAEKLGYKIGVGIHNAAVSKARLPGDGGIRVNIPKMIKLGEL